MNNVFAMVTLKSSNFYTGYALQSFFKYTEMEDDDEFLLINNDKSEMIINEDEIRNRELIRIDKINM